MTYIVAISAYLVLLTIFGLIVARKKVKTSDDMVTGGHRIPFIILVGTLLATWCGGGGITGSASVVYTGGPWVGLITFAAPPIGIILLYFIAGKVRKSNKVTVPEIMGARYGKAASIIAALCVMLAYVGVLATQLKAAADIIVLLCASSGIEISHGLALTICTALIAIITVGGGLVSVAYSDAISALLMIGGFFLAIPFLIGVANSQGATLPPEKMTITGGMSGWELLGYFLPSLALMLGDQNMLQRFASAKNSDEAKKSNIGMFIGEILVIISIVLAFLIIGPVASFASSLLGAAFTALFDLNATISGFLYGALIQVCVMFGVHWGFVAISVNNLATMGFDPITIAGLSSAFAQAGVVLMIMLKTRNKKLKSVCGPAILSAMVGITEPAIYGVTLQFKKPFILACLASGIGGAIIGFGGVKQYFYGTNGIFGWLQVINPETGFDSSVVAAIIACIVSFAAAIILMAVFGKNSVPQDQK